VNLEGLMEEAERQRAIVAFEADVTAASASFDKIVSYLAGGSLALSITFLHDIAPNPVHQGWLALAWTSLWVALIASMLSFLASDSAHRSVINKLYAGDELVGMDPGWRSKMTSTFNWASAIGVVVGTGSLAWFAFANLPIGGKP
jgi:hypothetical protein